MKTLTIKMNAEEYFDKHYNGWKEAAGEDFSLTPDSAIHYAVGFTQSLQDRVSDLEILLDACKSANQQAQDRVKELEEACRKMIDYYDNGKTSSGISFIEKALNQNNER